MNQMAYVFQAWLPLVVWQQVDAPKYRAGYITVLFLSLGMITMTGVTQWFSAREYAK
jgi:ACS family pantothenate transporter-like MFS transporter